MARSKGDVRRDVKVVAYGADWVPPWPLLRDKLQSLKADNIQVGHVDVAADPAAAERAHVVALPTVVVLADGKERRRFIGAVTVEQIRSTVKRQR